MPHDGDAGGELKEFIDTKTGKKMVRKKEPTIKQEVDPKTGKKVKFAKMIQYEIDRETGEQVAVEYDEIIDEDGNIVRVKKNVGGKPVVDNRAKNNAISNKIKTGGN